MKADLPVYFKIEIVCAGCGSHLMWLDKAPAPTTEPQRAACPQSYCQYFQREVSVPRFGTIA